MRFCVRAFDPGFFHDGLELAGQSVSAACLLAGERRKYRCIANAALMSEEFALQFRMQRYLDQLFCFAGDVREFFVLKVDALVNWFAARFEFQFSFATACWRHRKAGPRCNSQTGSRLSNRPRRLQRVSRPASE